MRVLPTDLPGVLLLEPQVFDDARGFVFESYNRRAFREATGVEADFVLDLHSRSSGPVLRGLHYQIGQSQGKLLRVIDGVIWDVAVDLRRSAPTFGRWTGVELSATNRRMLWIPPGFAHGFLVTADRAEVLYKLTGEYAPAHERTLLWNDPALGIAWPLRGTPIVSDKDRAGRPLVESETYP